MYLITKLRIVQNQRLRTAVVQLYREYQTLPIAQLHTLQILLIVYSFIYHNNELSEVFKVYFVINNSIHSYSTKYTNLLHIDVFKRSVGQRSIHYKGSVLWNQIPQVLQVPMSKYTKLQLSNHLHN